MIQLLSPIEAVPVVQDTHTAGGPAEMNEMAERHLCRVDLVDC